MLVRGVFTSEFWLSIVGLTLGAVKAQVLPDLPDEAFYTVIVYVLGRSVLKASAAKK